MIGHSADHEPERSLTENALLLLDRAVTMLSNSPGLVLVASFLAVLPLVLWRVVTQFYPLPPTLDSALCIVLSTLAWVVGTAAATEAQVWRKAHYGQFPQLRETLRALHLLPLVLTGLAGGLMMVAGSFLLYVPMLVVAAWLAFAGPAVQAEDLGPWRGIQRGRALSGDGRWLGLLYLVIPLVVAKLVLDMLPISFLHLRVGLTHETSPVLAVLMFVWSSVVDVLLVAFAASWLGSAYVELRAEEQAAAAGPARTSADPRTSTGASAPTDPRAGARPPASADPRSPGPLPRRPS